MLQQALEAAKESQRRLAQSTLPLRNGLLETMAELILGNGSEILAANHQDLSEADRRGLDAPRTARLALSEDKISSLADGLRAVAQLPDPLGRGNLWTLDNGLVLSQHRVPLGVIGLIYESRPSVTVEASALALKSGNAILLRGGREALHTNTALAALWGDALGHSDLPSSLVQLLPDPDRSVAQQLMHLKGLDLLIPRGGASLIRTVTEEATVPVIATGVGNCHLYIDQSANLEMGLKILLDAKMGNPAVCNAVETLLVHRSVGESFLPAAAALLSPHNVLWHGDSEVLELVPGAMAANESDWLEEYLGAEIACRVVENLDDALDHIGRYGSGHSESIVTDSYPNGQRFLSEVDAAVVYWNASTRFSDGHQFGFGAEVGISTQKLHARGPMGLDALTTTKTTAMGLGQTRDF